MRLFAAEVIPHFADGATSARQPEPLAEAR
jgi:hypothetical protein